MDEMYGSYSSGVWFSERILFEEEFRCTSELNSLTRFSGLHTLKQKLNKNVDPYRL